MLTMKVMTRSTIPADPRWRGTGHRRSLHAGHATARPAPGCSRVPHAWPGQHTVTWTAARFYRDVLGLAIYREFGLPDDRGVVFFLGQGLLEVSDRAPGPPGHSVMIWIQTYRPRLRAMISFWISVVPPPLATGSTASRQ